MGKLLEFRQELVARSLCRLIKTLWRNIFESFFFVYIHSISVLSDFVLILISMLQIDTSMKMSCYVTANLYWIL